MFGRDLKIYSSDDFPKELPRLSELYDKLFSDGKGFRGQLVSEVASFLSLTQKEKQLFAQTVEFIHNSSLLHDDLIDQAPLRRGKTAIWKEFGAEYAVLAGDYLLARVMVNLSRSGSLKLVQITSESISELLEGEWLQDSVRYKLDVSFEKMQRIHVLKTSSLFSWCLKAPYFYKDYSDDVIQALSIIGRDMGLLLQRSDDLLDFNIRNFEDKSSFTDLKAGFLNSFSIYLFQGLALDQSVFKIQSEADIFKIVDQEYYQSKLKSFDELNESLISEIHQKSEDLFKMDSSFKKLKDLTNKISPKLYWRK